MLIVKLVEKVVSYFSGVAIFLLGAAAVFLLVVIFREEGLVGLWNTVKVDIAGVMVKFIFVLVVFFVITGALNHLQKQHREKFRAIISGKEGTTKMIVLAAAMPGPAGGQQLQDAWNDNGIDKTKVLLCLVGMMALGINTILFRAKVLGGPLTLIWMSMAFLLLAQVWFVCRFKPWTWFG